MNSFIDMGADKGFATFIIFCLTPCMLKYAAQDKSTSITLSLDTCIKIFIIGLYVILNIYWFELEDMIFYALVSIMVAVFYPYLTRSSKYRNNFVGLRYRNWDDKLVLTSMVYFFAAVYATYKLQFQTGLICFITSIASGIYHRNREMKYFNLDNIFATALLVVFAYSLALSYGHNEVYFAVGALGIPVAVFLLVYCGMPSDILVKEDSTNNLCCFRSGRELYDVVHAFWHVASGVGPIMSIWYFDSITLSSSDEILYMKCLPFIAIGCGVVVNSLGNFAGIMPLD